MMLKIKYATTKNDILSCLDIREAVFIDEQNVPYDLEVDGLVIILRLSTICLVRLHV